LQREPVEGRGDHEPGELFGGEVGLIDTQQPAGRKSAEGLGEDADVAGPAACDVVGGDVR
jgi:hypothetical protein